MKNCGKTISIFAYYGKAEYTKKGFDPATTSLHRFTNSFLHEYKMTTLKMTILAS